ncbi:inositol-tetrakisphosphate 1-kinase 3-like [Physcomitrium patens]|uniref:Inositol 1,3,4-trisphosphate 5/6-kinase ATP-grasp domain-containing protein n=1 Tax=Physcomitrium patens TaxID=3218 RepID=A0A2K1JZ88_PHYPA|nr:hypothetical protein PHYPA_013963 [Physcomitrium patens]
MYQILEREDVVQHLEAYGSANSFSMALAYDRFGLSYLDTSLVLKEFMNHGRINGVSYPLQFIQHLP